MPLKLLLQLQSFGHLIKAILFPFCIGCLVLQTAFGRREAKLTLNKHTLEWRRTNAVSYKCTGSTHTHRERETHTHPVCLSSQPSSQTTRVIFLSRSLSLFLPLLRFVFAELSAWDWSWVSVLNLCPRAALCKHTAALLHLPHSNLHPVPLYH